MGDGLGIRQDLKRTWFPFFGRFGSRLTDVQRLAIPEVLARRNVVLCAPTASGKTEAILAPMIQRLLEEESPDGIQALYITPTRALANDLLERIHGPLAQVGWDTGMWTSDKKANLKNPPQVLITTPEGFDSLLSRHTKNMTTLRGMILDELHMIDGTYRGDQLRLLLRRLRLIQGKAIWTCMLSATITDPETVGRRYAENCSVVSIQGQRAIKWQIIPSGPRPIPDEALTRLRRAKARKILVFCNSRNDVEMIASDINRGVLRDRVLVHHGLISREERLAAETAFKSWPVAACVATSTLEVGIDIGDVDAVLLYRPPPSVASLLQRIGRGNRRSGRIFALGIPATPEDSQQFIMLFTLATSESLDTRDYTPKLGVAVQQTFSYLLQRRDIKTTRKNLARILKPLGLDEDDTQAILANLVKLGWIEIDAYGGILAGQKLEKDFRYGKMHSSIPDRGAWTVVDEAGSRIGFVTEVTPVFLIGGKARKVLRMDYRHQKVYVRTIPTRKGDLLLSGGATSDQGKYFTLLPGNLQEKSRMHTTAKQGHDQARGQGEKR